jgi:hypothetical protein
MTTYEELVTDIVLIDVIGFSKLSNAQQLGTVLRLGQMLTATLSDLTGVASREIPRK